MVDAKVGPIDPERIGTSRPVAILRGIETTPKGNQILSIWVGFRGEDHFPATPIIKVDSLVSDTKAPHLSRFTGKEVGQWERYMAWGDGVEVQGVINNDRRSVVLTEIGGAAVAPEADQSFFLEPVA